MPKLVTFPHPKSIQVVGIDTSAGDGAGVGDGDVDILVGGLLSL